MTKTGFAAYTGNTGYILSMGDPEKQVTGTAFCSAPFCDAEPGTCDHPQHYFWPLGYKRTDDNCYRVKRENLQYIER